MVKNVSKKSKKALKNKEHKKLNNQIEKKSNENDEIALKNNSSTVPNTEISNPSKKSLYQRINEFLLAHLPMYILILFLIVIFIVIQKNKKQVNNKNENETNIKKVEISNKDEQSKNPILKNKINKKSEINNDQKIKKQTKITQKQIENYLNKIDKKYSTEKNDLLLKKAKIVFFNGKKTIQLQGNFNTQKHYEYWFIINLTDLDLKINLKNAYLKYQAIDNIKFLKMQVKQFEKNAKLLETETLPNTKAYLFKISSTGNEATQYFANIFSKKTFPKEHIIISSE